MNANTSPEFVWELSAEESDSYLSEVRTEARRVLELEHAPVRLACLLLAGIVYVVPLALLQDQLLEVYAGMSEVRAKMGVAILLGISTLVALPLFGYLAHLSSESKSLAEAARRYVGIVVPTSRPGHVQVRFSTLEGTDEVLVKTDSNTPIGTPLVVYAVPEEGNLALVEFERRNEQRLRLGQLCR
jgi:hypothetical protein